MWHKDAFNYESHSLGKGYIATVGQHVKSAKRCCVVNVYAACSLKEKKRLWEDLSKCKEVSQIELWCFCGDFNAIRSQTERQGANKGDFTSEVKGFNEFIESNLLLDLPIVGKKFTWFRSNGTTKSRIDRVLVFEEWLQCWPMCDGDQEEENEVEVEDAQRHISSSSFLPQRITRSKAKELGSRLQMCSLFVVSFV